MNEPAPSPRLRIQEVLSLIIALTALRSLAATPTLDTFDGGGTPSTLVQSAAAPGPAIGALGPSGNFLRLTSSNGSQSNLAVYDKTITAASDTVTAEFDFRIGGGSRADGLGFALLNVNYYGSNGSCAFVGADEISATASLGIGFDVYKNTGNPNDPDNNHISLHFDNDWIESRALGSFGYSLYRPTLAAGDTFDHAKIIANLSAGTVTVIITPAGRAAFTIFDNYAISGLKPYLWRAYIGGRTGGQTVTVDVDNINVSAVDINPIAPVAVPDNYATLPGQALTIAAPGALSNDYDLNGDVLNTALDTDVSSGTLTLNPNGSFTYVPSDGFTGTDSFTYHANDGAGYDSAIVVVSIHVYEIPPGLAVWYKFDEGAGTTAADSSGNNYNGTLTNGPAWTDGVHGKALSFDGVDDTVENLVFSIPANCTITISYWNFVGTAELQLDSAFSIGTGGNSGTDRIQCHSPYSDRRLYWDFGNDSTGRLSADYASYLDKWTHVSLVSEGSTGAYRAVYLDGVLAASKSSSVGASAKTGLFVGYFSQPGTTWHHKGKIDDFQIYNRVLSVAEISQLSQRPPSAIPDSFTAYANQSVNIPAPGVLANDTDPNPDFLTAILDTNSTHGTLVLNADGSFTYTPENGFLGTDSFTYHANDGKGNNSAPAQVTINVVKATPTINWPNPAAITYGTGLSATQLNATADTGGSFAYTPAASTILSSGMRTLSVTFTPNDTANYNSATKSVSLIVNKAALTVTADNKTRLFGVANPPLTASYGGFVNNETATVLTGAPTLATSAATNSPPGNYPITITQGTLIAANYSFTFINGTFTVSNTPAFFNLSAPTIEYGTLSTNISGRISVGVAGAVSITFNGVTKSATIDETGAFAADFSTASLDLGAYPIQYFYPGGGAIGPAWDTRTLTVIKATPVLTWSNPADISYGTQLSDAQLNASANVAGTFVYNPPAGTVLTKGTHQLSTTFTPIEPAHYVSAGASVTLVVGLAQATITWASPADISYGTALSDAQLNARADIPGTFTYTPPLGTVLNAGDAQQLKLTFAPDDSVDYATSVLTVTINVLKADQSIAFAQIADQEIGSPALTLSATASSNLPVTITLVSGNATLQGSTLSFNGLGAITLRAEQAGDANFNAAPTLEQTFHVIIIPPHLTSALSSSGMQGRPFTFSLTASGTNPLTFESGTLPPGMALNANTGEISGTPAASGAFQIAVTARNGGGTETKTLTLVFASSGGGENHAPKFTSGVLAVPNPIAINQEMNFSAFASDEDGDSIAIVWDFGDGAQGFGAAATHRYTTSGVFAAKVTITDGVASDYLNMAIVVNGSVIPPDQYKQYVVSKLGLKFNFAKPNADSLSVSGTIPIPQAFSPNGKVVKFELGELEREWTLDKKATSADKAFKLTGKFAKDGTFAASPAKFALALKNAGLFADLQSLGFKNEDVNSKLVDASIVLTVDGTGYLAGLRVSYSARKNKNGIGKK